MKFGDENPSYVLAHLDQPLQLTCHAIITDVERINEDLESPFYYSDVKTPDQESIRLQYKKQQEDSALSKNNNEYVPQTAGMADMTRYKRAKVKKDEGEEIEDKTTKDESAKRLHGLYNEQLLNHSKPTKMTKQRQRRFLSDEDDADAPALADEDYDVVKPEDLSKKYQHQLEIHHFKNSTRKRRSVDDDLIFTWFKDNKVINITSENETDKLYVMTENGTLKFAANQDTSGKYHCHVKHLLKKINPDSDDEKKVYIGPIISKSTMVQLASE